MTSQRATRTISFSENWTRQREENILVSDRLDVTTLLENTGSAHSAFNGTFNASVPESPAEAGGEI